MTNKVVGEIYKTDNLQMFKTLDANRNVKAVRVNKLEESIRENGYIGAPIIVNEKYEVIDGQGRLEACKRLGVPIHYTVVKNIGIHECIVLNQSTQNWELQDYIRSYAHQGNENYMRIMNLMEYAKSRVGSLPINVMTYIVIGIMNRGHIYMKTGNVVFTEEDYRKSIEMIDYLKDFTPILEKLGIKCAYMWNGIIFAYRYPKTDKNRLLLAFEQHGAMIPHKPADFDTALQFTTDVYNNRLPKNRRIFYNIIAEVNR